MSISGSRGLIRISHNPDCQLLTAMVRERIGEPEMYRLVTGQEYEGEYGQRQSAIRRGNQFEENLFKNNAQVLRREIGKFYGYDSEALTLRNFKEEIQGNGREVAEQRLQATVGVFRELASGQPVPDLLIQPQLKLQVCGSSGETMLIAPDVLIFDRSSRIYRPGEAKSGILRKSSSNGNKLESARLQAAVEILALRAILKPFGLDGHVDSRAVFIFGSPFGMKPHLPFEERLDAEIREVSLALSALADVKARLEELRNGSDSPIESLAPNLKINFQQSCMNSCIFANHCKSKHLDSVRSLGDKAAELFGAETSFAHLEALLAGQVEPITATELLFVQLATTCGAI